MAFLQINNPDGTSGIKRPFRLSDIQEIWNGIKSLFKAISGQSFRIISGFDLSNGVYKSGTVWYNGELYEYDSSTYPITPSTTRVAFARVAQDNRVWEDGDTLPFSYKYVCGGDTLDGEFTSESFVRDIENFKSFLGDESITSRKLAKNSVTLEKITPAARVPIFDFEAYGGVDINQMIDDEFNIADVIQSTGMPALFITENSSSTLYFKVGAHKNDPAVIFTDIQNNRTTDTTIIFRNSYGEEINRFVLPKRTGNVPSKTNIILVKKRTGFATDSYEYNIFSAVTVR
jgi:hypothetical protein